jgi:hypothetical protein
MVRCFSGLFFSANIQLQDAKSTKGTPLSSNLTFYDIPWPVLGTVSSFPDLTTQTIAASAFRFFILKARAVVRTFVLPS